MKDQEDEVQDGWGKLPKPLKVLPTLPTPWPQLDDVLALRPHRLVAVGGRSRSREAESGYDIAVHNAALGTSVLMCAPRLTPRNALPRLTIDRTENLTAGAVEELVQGHSDGTQPIELVVIDRLQLMCTADGRPVRASADVDEIGSRLKKIARRYAVPILIMARLERPRRAGVPLEAEDLGLAEELVYTANTVVLLDRTAPAEVDVLVTKDTSGNGPAPRRVAVDW